MRWLRTPESMRELLGNWQSCRDGAQSSCVWSM
jgi:hypothetical protein